MRIIFFVCLLLGASLPLKAALFFWNNTEANMCCLHVNGYDICIEGGCFAGMNNIDIPRVTKYIKEVLMPHQEMVILQRLQQLLHLLSMSTITISYCRNYTGVVNRLSPIDPAKKAADDLAKKPVSLTESQKKDLLLSYLVSQGLAKRP